MLSLYDKGGYALHIKPYPGQLAVWVIKIVHRSGAKGKLKFEMTLTIRIGRGTYRSEGQLYAYALRGSCEYNGG
jgi:hypothetical protein